MVNLVVDDKIVIKCHQQTGGMTSGRTMLRAFRRSSMGVMSCVLPRLRHGDKESIYVLC